MHALRSAASEAAPNFLLSRKQAAAWLNISIRKLDALVASGRLRATRIDSSVRFAPADLEAFVASLQEGGRQ